MAHRFRSREFNRTSIWSWVWVSTAASREQVSRCFEMVVEKPSFDHRYLFENASVLLTSAFTGGNDHRRFGVGYACTSGSHGSLTVNHTMAVLPGDDPTVLVEIQVTNLGTNAKAFPSSACVVRTFEDMCRSVALGLSSCQPDSFSS